MGFFDDIKSKFGKGKIKKEQIERLREIMTVAIDDGEVTDFELDNINTFFLQSELSVEDFQALKTEALMNVVNLAIADRRVTDFESDALKKIINQFDLPPAVFNQVKEKVKYFEALALLDSDAPLPVGNPTNLILKKDETAHASLPAFLMEERVTSRQYTGSSKGISVPIVKGIRFNVGAQRGQSHSITESVCVSEGYFIITNKRLVFSGTRKSVSSDLSKLLDMQIYSNALQFSVTSRQKPTTVKFSRGEEVEMCGVIISRLLNETVK